MPSNFLCYSKSLIITIPNGAFGQLKFASALFELAEMFWTSQKFNNTYAAPVYNISIAACYQIWKENALMRARSFPKWYSNVFLRCLNFWGSIKQVVWYMELMYMLAEGAISGTCLNFKGLSACCSFKMYWVLTSTLAILVYLICFVTWLWKTGRSLKTGSLIHFFKVFCKICIK